MTRINKVILPAPDVDSYTGLVTITIREGESARLLAVTGGFENGAGGTCQPVIEIADGDSNPLRIGGPEMPSAANRDVTWAVGMQGANVSFNVDGATANEGLPSVWWKKSITVGVEVVQGSATYQLGSFAVWYELDDGRP